MSAFLTYCGFYCSFTALIGVYFFIVLSIMEFRGNPQVFYHWQWQEGKTVAEQPSMNAKGVAFLILAGIELLLVILCYLCGNNSMKSDAEAEEKEMKNMRMQNYERVDNVQGTNE